MEYVVFDIETTGLDTLEDRILEIGAIRVKDDQIIAEFNKLINPGIPIPRVVTEINGITDEMVQNEAYPGVVLTEFKNFIAGAEFLIGHNAIRFDYPFIKSEFKRNFVKHDDFVIRDTVWIARKKLHRLRNYSLKSLTGYYGIENVNAHQALSDVYATYNLFIKLNQE